jgi:hypothetical protein
MTLAWEDNLRAQSAMLHIDPANYTGASCHVLDLHMLSSNRELRYRY